MSTELNGLSTSRTSSEALVLDNDCEVETVNCTRYSPVRLKQAKPDRPPCNENIQHDWHTEVLFVMRTFILKSGLECTLVPLQSLKLATSVRSSWIFIKEAASLLRHQLEDVISQKAELETSMKDIVDENQRQHISIASLKT